MSQKYEILYEAGWDDSNQSPKYKRLTTIKNERAAIDFINNVDNVGKYGNMLIRTKIDGALWTYNDKTGSWDK